MAATPERRLNKRRGPDIWVKITRWFGICSWILMGIVIALLDKARPQLTTFFDRIFNVDLRTTWDYNLVRSTLILMVVQVCLSVTGLFINSRRHRRKEDRYNRSLIVMGILGVLGIVFCLWYGDLFKAV